MGDDISRRQLLSRIPALLGCGFAASIIEACSMPATSSHDDAANADMGAPDAFTDAQMPAEDLGADPEDPAQCPGFEDFDRARWTEVPLMEYPELREPGGWAVVERPQELLDVHLVRLDTEAPCYLAVWRVCTHGACHVEYRPDRAHYWCPCHGSIFGERGRVERGPATEDLRTLRAIEWDGSIWIEPLY